MSVAAPNWSDLPSNPGFLRLKSHVLHATGLAYYEDKNDEFASHVGRRLTALRLPHYEAYLAYLLDGRSGDVELDQLAACLTIGETFFFRHSEMFESLAALVVPEILERNRDRRSIRIWSAGCAIGAEAYSTAILLRRRFAERLAGWDVTIVGTDINRHFLAQAQQGEFNDWAFRSLDPAIKEACFTRQGNAWTIRDEYRRGVSFQYHNLVLHPFPSPVNDLWAFDLILCRNVMIYFDAPTTQRVVQHFHDTLVDGGWFVVGHSEPNIETFRKFQTVNAPGAVLYRRTATPPTIPFNFPTFSPSLPPLDACSATTAVELLPPPSVAPIPPSIPSPPMRAALVISPAEIRALLDRGEWMQAEAACRAAADAHRLNPLFHFYRALSAEQAGRHEETEQALRRTIYLDRGFVLAHYHLALVHQRRAETAEAKRYFRNVAALLVGRDEREEVADADGLTAGELRQLAQMQLEVLERT